VFSAERWPEAVSLKNPRPRLSKGLAGAGRHGECISHRPTPEINGAAVCKVDTDIGVKLNKYGSIDRTARYSSYGHRQPLPILVNQCE